jgi:NADH:ubiquinone oxidoreductase subunit 3 (subunit A)
MVGLIYSPPVVFLIFVVIFIVSSKVFSLYAPRNVQREHGLDAYACGQRNVQHYVNPDYSQFFPFAFFFTIMHVLALVVATASYEALLLPVVYIASGILAMIIIFKN